MSNHQPNKQQLIPKTKKTGSVSDLVRYDKPRLSGTEKKELYCKKYLQENWIRSDIAYYVFINKIYKRHLLRTLKNDGPDGRLIYCVKFIIFHDADSPVYRNYPMD